MVSEARSSNRRSPWIRWLLILFGVLLALVVAGAGILAWVAGTEQGTRAVVTRLLERAGDAVAVEGLRGRLLGPLHAERIVLETPDRRIELHDVRIQWQPRMLLGDRVLHIDDLHVRHLAVIDRIERVPESPEPESAAPDNLALPFELNLEKLRIEGGELRRGPVQVATLGASEAGLQFDGEQYRVELRQFGARPEMEDGSARAALQGHLELGAAHPFPVQGRIAIDSKAQLEQNQLGANGVLSLTNSLTDLQVGLEMKVNGEPVTGKARLHLFSEQLLGEAELHARALALAAIDARLPGAVLDVDFSMSEAQDGRLRLRNRAPGSMSEKGVPIRALELDIAQVEDGLIFPHISLVLGTDNPAGTLQGDGSYRDGALRLALNTDGLNLQRLDPDLRQTDLAGTLALRHEEGAQAFKVDLTEPYGQQGLHLEAEGLLADAVLEIRRARLQAGTGELKLSGRAFLENDQAFQAQGEVSRFRLHDFGSFKDIPPMNLSGNFEVNGSRDPELRANLRFSISNSTLAGHPLQGQGQAQLQDNRLEVPNLALVSGDNRLAVQGRLAEQESRLTFSLSAPNLAQLGEPFGGALHLSGVATGTPDSPRLDLEWSAENAVLPTGIRVERSTGAAQLEIDLNAPFPVRQLEGSLTATGVQREDLRLQAADLRIQFAPEPSAPLMLNLDLKELMVDGITIDQGDLQVGGTRAEHRITARVRENGQEWSARATGGLDALAADARWEGVLQAFTARGNINATVRQPAPLLVSAERTRIEDLDLEIDGGALELEYLGLEPEGMETRGRIVRVNAGELLSRFPLGQQIETDLQLSGSWDLRYDETLRGRLNLVRDSGDIVVLGASPTRLGLTDLQVRMQAEDGNANLSLLAEGEQLGTLALDAQAPLGQPGNPLAVDPNAPLAGTARVDIPSLAWLGPMVNPILLTGGRLQGDIRLDGTLGAPELSGRVTGSALQVAHAEYGIDLRQGNLRSEFTGDRLQIEGLTFEGTQGEIRISGPIDFGAAPAASLLLQAERFAVFNRPDRRLVVSGDTELSWRDDKASVRGRFNVDAGYFDIGTGERPTLSEDVVVEGEGASTEGGIAAAVDVTVELNNKVRVEGRGLDILLGGQVRLHSEIGEPLQAAGTLRVVKGTYSAYTRELAIERGTVRFTGPIDNPALDILAMRRGQEVEAGVSVRGTVLAPRVTLVSEPSVPDAEKLAWLVLGRSLANAGAGDIGSLQGAAASLLAQGAVAGVQARIASAFGLDTFSVGTSSDNLRERIITVGKQISSRLYLGYQHGLESAAGVVQLRYALTPSLSIEAEAGGRSALSLFYNITFD